MINCRLELETDNNDTILVTSPDFPLVTYGETKDDAMKNAVDAAHVLLQSMIDDREAIPRASVGEDGGPRLRMPLQTVLKVALYDALFEKGLTRADLQRLLGWQRESVDRLFRLDHNSKVEQIGAAFKALDKDVSLSLTEFAQIAA